MTKVRRTQSGFAWLELVLALAILALLGQLFPSVERLIYLVFDIRNWSQLAWIIANLMVVTTLVCIRFSCELLSLRQTADGGHSARMSIDAVEKERRSKSVELKKERELYQRMHDARKRQSY
jgi:hypothetical protein